MPLERPYEHWMELVRSFRTFYDHFRIAFPHLTSIPKHYDKNWGQEFRVLARDFVRNEDMRAVKRVFDSAGYGTERWDKLVSLQPEDLAGCFDRIITSNGVGKDEAIARLIDAVGMEPWERILNDPSILVQALQEQEPGPSDTVSEATDSASQLSEAKGDGAADHLTALKTIREEKRDLETLLEKVQAELSEAGKTADKLDQELADQARDYNATEKKLASVEEKLKEAEAKAQKARIPERPDALAPTKAVQQHEEVQATLLRAEERLDKLEEKSETDDLRIKELMGDLQREEYLRQKFEDDLEGTRNALKEQIQRLHAVLKNDEEIPSIDEFEQMTGDELMDYIGDVEKEKVRVMAGLEALDTQEEGYQKQIEAQHEQLCAIQEDLGRLKESSLAMEMGEMRETLEKQRNQLTTLMGYSKNLKSRNEQLVDRQGPLRNLVHKLNLQEKALVRFIRMNYDSKFMPNHANM